METLKTSDIMIEEIKIDYPEIKQAAEVPNEPAEDEVKKPVKEKIIEKVKRPDMVEAKVYKLKSRFVNENLYITLSYVRDDEGKARPIEIFINSKDLSKLPEYTVLTRLISAIFRHFKSPKFILDELQSIYDPNGGYFLKGKYIYSFYSEIAMIIEKFFYDIGFLVKEEGLDSWIEEKKTAASKKTTENMVEMNSFKICPTCNQKSLQVDGGCLQCVNPECGYSKCS